MLRHSHLEAPLLILLIPLVLLATTASFWARNMLASICRPFSCCHVTLEAHLLLLLSPLDIVIVVLLVEFHAVLVILLWLQFASLIWYWMLSWLKFDTDTFSARAATDTEYNSS